MKPPGQGRGTSPWCRSYTSVSIRSLSIRRTLHSTAVRFVMARAQDWGNQPLSPSRSLSPQHQPRRRTSTDTTGKGGGGWGRVCRAAAAGLPCHGGAHSGALPRLLRAALLSHPGAPRLPTRGSSSSSSAPLSSAGPQLQPRGWTSAPATASWKLPKIAQPPAG